MYNCSGSITRGSRSLFMVRGKAQKCVELGCQCSRAEQGHVGEDTPIVNTLDRSDDVMVARTMCNVVKVSISGTNSDRVPFLAPAWSASFNVVSFVASSHSNIYLYCTYF